MAEYMADYGWLGWILIGLIAGAIAKALYKGDDQSSVVRTLAVCVVGAVLGGLTATTLGDGSLSSFFSVGAWLIAFGGAFVLLMVVDAVVVRRAEQRNAGART